MEKEQKVGDKKRIWDQEEQLKRIRNDYIRKRQRSENGRESISWKHSYIHTSIYVFEVSEWKAYLLSLKMLNYWRRSRISFVVIPVPWTLSPIVGEQSGKANRSVARHIPGPNLEQLGQRASTAASEISRAHQLAMERGEKLNLLEERAERMANTAQDFSGTAHQLMLKYKDKKWYQL